MHPLKREFKRLFDASGWKQVEAARKLHMTRGGLNGIVTGRTVPSPATLELFRRILIVENPSAVSARPPIEMEPPSELTAEDVAEALHDLNQEDRVRLAELAFEALTIVKRVALRKPAESKATPLRSSSDVSAFEAKHALAAARAAGTPVPGEPPLDEAASTIDREAEPQRGTERRYSRRQSPPKQAPTESKS